MGWPSCQAQTCGVPDSESSVIRILGSVRSDVCPEGVGLSQSTIRARKAQEEVRGQRRIRSSSVHIAVPMRRWGPFRDRCRWTTVTWVRSRAYVDVLYVSNALDERLDS